MRPMAGSRRRIGTITGLVSCTMARASGLRKSARDHCSSSRSNTASIARDNNVWTRKISAAMSGFRYDSDRLLAARSASSALRAAAARSAPCYQSVESSGMSNSSAASVVPPLDVTAARCSARLPNVREHAAAMQRLGGQQRRGRRLQSERDSGLRQLLRQQKEIRRSAARQRGDDIQFAFSAQPHEAAGSARRPVPPAVAVRPERSAARYSAGDAGADQGRPVRHGPHDRHAGGQSCARSSMRTPATIDSSAATSAASAARRLRSTAAATCGLTASTTSCGAVDGRAIVGVVTARRISRSSAARAAASRLPDAQLLRRAALAQQPGDQRASHVAAADECDALSRCHVSIGSILPSPA